MIPAPRKLMTAKSAVSDLEVREILRLILVKLTRYTLPDTTYQILILALNSNQLKRGLKCSERFINRARSNLFQRADGLLQFKRL
jgi:hypothetical protein